MPPLCVNHRAGGRTETKGEISFHCQWLLKTCPQGRQSTVRRKEEEPKRQQRWKNNMTGEKKNMGSSGDKTIPEMATGICSWGYYCIQEIHEMNTTARIPSATLRSFMEDSIPAIPV